MAKHNTTVDRVPSDTRVHAAGTIDRIEVNDVTRTLDELMAKRNSFPLANHPAARISPPNYLLSPCISRRTVSGATTATHGYRCLKQKYADHTFVSNLLAQKRVSIHRNRDRGSDLRCYPDCSSNSASTIIRATSGILYFACQPSFRFALAGFALPTDRSVGRAGVAPTTT